jgi:hypothetical protein
MTSTRYRTGGLLPLLAVLVVCLAPAVSHAQNISLANDLPIPVVVQFEVVIRGVMRRDRPIPIRSGATVQPIRFETAKTIVIYDGRNPNRVLHREMLPATPNNRTFRIEATRDKPGFRLREVNPSK